VKRLEQLELEAIERRQRLSEAAARLRYKLAPEALAAEALQTVDARLPTLKGLETAVKRYPLIAAAILAGAGFLFRRAIRAPASSRSSTSRSKLHQL
jgi:hypothetical protein